MLRLRSRARHLFLKRQNRIEAFTKKIGLKKIDGDVLVPKREVAERKTKNQIK
jgi:hypothetical protein